MTNLLKNAIESVENNTDEKHINFVCLMHSDERLFVGVNDDGAGLPTTNIEELTEPYVTHKKKGTGLGLAIVKKIIEDHEGELLFDTPLSILNDVNAPYIPLSGASVFFSLPLNKDTA